MVALYAKKIKMTHVFNDVGGLVPVTLLEVEKNLVVLKKKCLASNRDVAVLSAFQEVKEKRIPKAIKGQFPKDSVLRKKMFEVDGFSDKNPGDEIGIEVFENILFVDVSAVSKGRGFQGVMKRHGAHGGPARHGSKFHRSPGSVGQTGPTHLHKGTKMPGRMGGAKCTVQNLKVVKVDLELGVLAVAGAVPGANGGHVLVKTSVKKMIF